MPCYLKIDTTKKIKVECTQIKQVSQLGRENSIPQLFILLERNFTITIDQNS
jgi:hypothetical protein